MDYDNWRFSTDSVNFEKRTAKKFESLYVSPFDNTIFKFAEIIRNWFGFAVMYFCHITKEK